MFQVQTFVQLSHVIIGYGIDFLEGLLVRVNSPLVLTYLKSLV